MTELQRTFAAVITRHLHHITELSDGPNADTPWIQARISAHRHAIAHIKAEMYQGNED
jgi:hypothetical protein